MSPALQAATLKNAFQLTAQPLLSRPFLLSMKVSLSHYEVAA